MRQSPAEIEQYQAKRIHELLVYAVRHCNFYRTRFLAAGLTQERDLTAENLQLIPVLTKHNVQESMESLLATNVNRRTWRQNSSGGSSGQTVMLMQDATYREEGDATSYVSDRMQGWDFGKRVAMLWGGPQDTRSGRNIKDRVLLYLSNHRLYDSFDMNVPRMRRYHRNLECYQPDSIVAYSSSAYLFARFLLEQQLSPSYPRASIICSAETLTQEMRSIVEDCFRVPVYNRYGSREVGCIASQCKPGSGLHTHLDKIVEVLDLKTATPVLDTPGRIVVTLLSNRALPLIRYDLGDIGIRTSKPCVCGVNTPVLEKVLGRSSDFIRAPSGRLIHGEYFTHVFYGRRNVRQFQFVQESPTNFVVRVIKSGELAPAQLEDIRHEIVAVLGSSANLRFEFPECIPPLPSGKFRFTISNAKLSLEA